MLARASSFAPEKVVGVARPCCCERVVSACVCSQHLTIHSPFSLNSSSSAGVCAHHNKPVPLAGHSFHCIVQVCPETRPPPLTDTGTSRRGIPHRPSWSFQSAQNIVDIGHSSTNSWPSTDSLTTGDFTVNPTPCRPCWWKGCQTPSFLLAVSRKRGGRQQRSQSVRPPCPPCLLQ